MPHRFLFALSLLLLAAISLVIYGSKRARERTFHGTLLDALPETPSGWTRTLRPIADTPEMQKAISEKLNFDDGVFAEYTRGSDRLSVYVAYWTPGRMSHRLVASHTPDVCWIGAGWQCTERGMLSVAMETRSSGLGADPLRSNRFPAESRTFVGHGRTEYVWFWHIVGARTISYGTQTPPWYAILGDLLSKGLDQREEQFFIRLSAPQPLGNPVFAPVRDPLLRWIESHGR